MSVRWLWLALALPGAALAHSPIKGLGDFYNGILHPLFVPAQLLLVVALGLLIGQQGVQRHLSAVAGYALGVVAGLTLVGQYPQLLAPERLELAILGAAVVLALLVVLARALPRVLLTVLAALAGLLLGFDSLQSDLAGGARAVALFGSGIALYLLMLYPMALAERFQGYAWTRIGTRVLGSWITASALLVLALALSPLRPAEPGSTPTPGDPRTSTAPLD